MKHLKLAPLLSLIALSSSTTACEAVVVGEGETGSGDGENGFVTSEGNTRVEAASFSGSIGEVTDISTDAGGTAFDDGYYASVTLTTINDSWGAMVAFNLSGADRDALFTAGSVIVLSPDSVAFSYACSGDDSDPFGYETNQTSGIISISAGPDDLLQVDFEVSYDAGDNASGSFQIEAR